MPMTAKEAARAMMWVKAQGLSDSKAIELINFITDTNVPNGMEKEEELETKNNATEATLKIEPKPKSK